MQNHANPKGKTPAKYILCSAVALLLAAPTRADTVYRCGDAYSPLTACVQGPAVELPPSSDHPHHNPGAALTPAQDWQEAQALEKQRRLSERAAAPTVPVRVPIAPAPEPTTNTPAPTWHRGKHARRPVSPYFTAADPASKPKKKSTAQAVPAKTP